MPHKSGATATNSILLQRKEPRKITEEGRNNYSGLRVDGTDPIVGGLYGPPICLGHLEACAIYSETTVCGTVDAPRILNRSFGSFHPLRFKPPLLTEADVHVSSLRSPRIRAEPPAAQSGLRSGLGCFGGLLPVPGDGQHARRWWENLHPMGTIL